MQLNLPEATIDTPQPRQVMAAEPQASAEDSLQMTIGEDEINLAQLGGVDLADVDAVRFIVTPAGVFRFECIKGELTTATRDKKAVPCASFELAIREVISLASDAHTKEEVLTMVHGHQIAVRPDEANAIVRWLGRIKAFLEDTGFRGTGTLNQLCANYVGHEFRAPIRQTASKDDPDRKFANIVEDKARAVAELAA